MAAFVNQFLDIVMNVTPEDYANAPPSAVERARQAVVELWPHSDLPKLPEAELYDLLKRAVRARNKIIAATAPAEEAS